MPATMQAVPAPYSKSQEVFDFDFSLCELIKGQDFLENEEFKTLCEKSESSFSQFGDDETSKISERFDSVNDLNEKVRKASGSSGDKKAKTLPASSIGNRRTISASAPLQELILTQEKHQQHIEVIADVNCLSSSNHDGKEQFPLLSWSDFLNDDILDGDQIHTKEEASEEDCKSQKEAIKNRNSSDCKGSREKVHGKSSAKEVRSKSSSKQSKSEKHKGELKRERERRHLSKSRHCERRQRSSTRESDTDRQSSCRSAAPFEGDVNTLLGSNRRSNGTSRNDLGLDSSIHSCLIPVKRSDPHDKNPGLEAKAIHGSQRKSQDLDMSTHSVHVSKDIAQSRRRQLSGSVIHRRKSLDTGASIHSVHVSKVIEKASKTSHCEQRQRSSTKESDTDRQLSRSAAASKVKRSDSHDKNPGLEAKSIHRSQRKSQDLDISTHSVHVSKDIAQSRRSHRSGSVLNRRKSKDMDASTHSVHVSRDTWKAFPEKDSDGALLKSLPTFVNDMEEEIPKGSLHIHSRSQVKHRPTPSRDAQKRHLGRDEHSDNASPQVGARVARRSCRRTTII
jgi:hypothetical protein